VALRPDGRTSRPPGSVHRNRPDREPRYVQETNELNRIYIVDVEGERLTFNGRFPAVTTAADRSELEAIIASIDIEP